jgi:acyl carrier protein
MLGGRGYIESNIAPQLLRDARVLRIFEGPTETLYSHLGASLGQADCAAAAFIGGPLKHPELAAQLLAFAKANRVAAVTGKRLFASPSAASQWLDYRFGELAAAAFLLAATETRARADGMPGQEAAARSASWARQRYDALAQAIASQLEARSPFAGSAAVLAEVQAYAGAIGDVEQLLPGEEQQLDPLLRSAHGTPGVATPAPAAMPAVPGPVQDAPADEASAALRSLVHASVLKWLRGEPHGATAALDDDTPFASIGIDSLATASIAVDLEQQTGVTLPPELLFDLQTVRALAAYIAGRMAPIETDRAAA